jgi:CRP/FNR family transcriptional regulator, cyclic AMP receptor protein
MAMTEIFSQVPLFAQLPAEGLEELAEHLRRRRFGRGDAIFYQGDPGTSLCIVAEGRVKLSLISSQGREIIIDLVRSGEVFGEMALLDGEPRSADAVAVEPTILMLLDRQDFIDCLLKRPQLAVDLLGILSRRLRRDASLLQDAAFLDVPARLARTILRLAEPPRDGGEPMTPRLNQTDLAGLTGTTRETLNKWLGVFQDEGLVRLDRGRIAVLQAQQLKQRIV